MSSIPFKYRRRNLKRLVKLLFASPRDFIWFTRCLRAWEKAAPAGWRATEAEMNICVNDRHASAGAAQGHYFLQDLWAAQHVHRFAADRHVDIGSSVKGFVSHVASFLPVEYVDIRPLDCCVPNLSYRAGSILKLPFADRSVSSLSCLHVIEHIGLGRYGDPIQPEGWRAGLAEIQRVLAPHGQLLLGAPCGIPCVQFNAHRIFTPEHITGELRSLRLEEFSLIEDDHARKWISDCSFTRSERLTFGCGLFRFSKPTSG
jgi:SAM-dependent methyltransferase